MPQITQNECMFGLIFWVIVAFGTLGFVGWSLNGLMAQRAAWRLFADKHKLEYMQDKGIYGAAAVTGAIGGRRLNIYPVQTVGAGRYYHATFVHIEVFLNNVPDVRMLLSAKALPDMIADWGLPDALLVEGRDFPKLQVAQCDDAKAANAWWQHGRRAAALKAFMDSAGADDEALMVADGEQAFLIWRTSDAMRDVRVLNAQVQKLFGFAASMDSAKA